MKHGIIVLSGILIFSNITIASEVEPYYILNFGSKSIIW